MRRIELVTADDLEHRLAVNLMQGAMPDSFLHIGGVRNQPALDSPADSAVKAELQELLEESLLTISDSISRAKCVVSLRAGRGEKERALLEAIAGSAFPRYLAVGTNCRALETAIAAVAGLDIEKLGLVAFVEDMPLIREHWEPPVLLCLLDNSFCDYHPDPLLDLIYEHLDLDDLFLFDCHLQPNDKSEEEQVGQVCRSRQNVLLNIGPLVDRGMEPDACVFNLDMIEQETSIGKACTMCRWLDITRDTTVCCGACNVRLDAGSRIELGFTYQYTQGQVMDCLQKQGFESPHSFISTDGNNLLVLARKTPLY